MLIGLLGAHLLLGAACCVLELQSGFGSQLLVRCRHHKARFAGAGVVLAQPPCWASAYKVPLSCFVPSCYVFLGWPCKHATVSCNWAFQAR